MANLNKLRLSILASINSEPGSNMDISERDSFKNISCYGIDMLIKSLDIDDLIIFKDGIYYPTSKGEKELKKKGYL